MATFRAINAACNAVMELLRNAYDPADFDRAVDFKVCTGRDFEEAITEGLSLMLYRVFYNGVIRNPPGRLRADGVQLKPGLPLDLHVLLTSWAPGADLQHELLGWAMRVIEDTPSIPAAVLNTTAPNIFRQDETIEIVPTELSTENLFRIWETVTDKNYQISMPYVIRIVNIESIFPESGGDFVQQRNFGLSGKLD